MNITYQLTQEEYIQAVNLHHKKGARLLRLTIYVALAAIIVIFGTDFSNSREVTFNIIAAFFSIAFYMLFVRILTQYQARSVYQKSTTLPFENRLRISGKGIRLDKDDKELSIPWSAFTHWKSDENFYLLYTTPRRFNVIPSRAFDEKKKEEFEGYLKKYIPQGGTIS